MKGEIKLYNISFLILKVELHFKYIKVNKSLSKILVHKHKNAFECIHYTPGFSNRTACLDIQFNQKVD